MKCQSFPWFTISSTASLCAVLLFCSNSIGLAADMVLFEDEVNPVMSVALDSGLARGNRTA
jgi:hypothetical protein